MFPRTVEVTALPLPLCRFATFHLTGESHLSLQIFNLVRTYVAEQHIGCSLRGAQFKMQKKLYPCRRHTLTFHYSLFTFHYSLKTKNRLVRDGFGFYVLVCNTLCEHSVCNLFKACNVCACNQVTGHTVSFSSVK